MLTIGQAARYAGTTPRAVRFYHARGLLPQPERDASGYRRYDAQAVVDLIRIRTLAEAGVPLARVHEVLQAGDAALAEAVEGIDRDLRRRIAELERHRRSLAALRTGDALALPPDVVAYLDGLRTIGVGETTVAVERDAWIILNAKVPALVPVMVRPKLHALADPEYRRICLVHDQAHGWDPDDPRLVDLADAMVGWWKRHPTEAPDAGAEDLGGAHLLVLDWLDDRSSPAWRRLDALVAQRSGLPQP